MKWYTAIIIGAIVLVPVGAMQYDRLGAVEDFSEATVLNGALVHRVLYSAGGLGNLQGHDITVVGELTHCNAVGCASAIRQALRDCRSVSDSCIPAWRPPAEMPLLLMAQPARRLPDGLATRVAKAWTSPQTLCTSRMEYEGYGGYSEHKTLCISEKDRLLIYRSVNL